MKSIEELKLTHPALRELFMGIQWGLEHWKTEGGIGDPFTRFSIDWCNRWIGRTDEAVKENLSPLGMLSAVPSDPPHIFFRSTPKESKR